MRRRRRYHKIIKKKPTVKTPGKVMPGKLQQKAAMNDETVYSEPMTATSGTATSEESVEKNEKPAETEERNTFSPEQSKNTEEEREEETESQNETNVHGDVCFPLVSSHIHGDEVKTTGLLVSPNGCGFMQTAAMPRNLRVSAKRAAPMIAAAHRGILRNLAAKELQRKVAEAFVTRARQGDQNAMAMIAMARDNAKRGIPQAVTAVQHMQDFITKNPVKSGVFGMEECKCVRLDGQNAVQLANGPSLTNSRIRNVGASFGEDADIMFKGLRNWQTEHDKKHEKLAQALSAMQRDILKIGRTLGMARAIQIVRHPNGNIAAYSPSAAWELDE